MNDKPEKEIVVFLNNQEGGILYIGLNDDGHPAGTIDLDSTQLKIADRIKNNILPSTLGVKDVGLVEQLGSGMSRILKVYDKDIFQISEHFIKVVFPFAEKRNYGGIENGTAPQVCASHKRRSKKTRFGWKRFLEAGTFGACSSGDWLWVVEAV